MERIEWIHLGNHTYPMVFSIGARKELETKYKNIQDYFDKCADPAAVSEAYLDGLETFIKYGCMRINVLGDAKRPEGAAINEEGKWEPITRETLEILICPGDEPEVGAKIFSAINKGAMAEIKAKPTKETRKNSKAEPEEATA